MTNLVSDGFRVARGLIPSQVCDAIRNAFSLEVKNHKQPLLRQRSVAREGHDFSEGHLMTNALLDVHHGMEAFPAFNSAVKGLVEDPSLREPLSTLFGEPAVLVQTMYFESSKGTPAHYDHCFLDSSDGERKELYGAWIALEAIEQAAGRFFLYPYSHWAGTPHAKPDVNRLHAEYVAASREVIDLYDKGPSIKCLRYVKTARGLLDELIEAAGWMPITPTLGKGDVLFFSSRMLHGSHPPQDPERSRNSLTAHFLPLSTRRVRYASTVEPLDLDPDASQPVHRTRRYRKSKLGPRSGYGGQ